MIIFEGPHPSCFSYLEINNIFTSCPNLRTAILQLLHLLEILLKRRDFVMKMVFKYSSS